MASTITIPLSSNSPDEGTIELSYNRDYTSYSGLFSFVLYFRGSIDALRKSKYYFGIKSYIDFTHNTRDEILRNFFRDVGIIIYTDPYCSQLMKEAFGTHEKVIIATVNWPRYMLNVTGHPQIMPDSLLRIMRFQALDAFPNSYICMRDADTIFPMEIKNTIGINNGNIFFNYRECTLIFPEDKSVTSENLDQLVADKVGIWEMTFIEKWMAVPQSMLFGMNEKSYMMNWHKNIPLTLNIDRDKKISMKDLSNKYILYKRIYSDQLKHLSNNIRGALTTQNNNPILLTHDFSYGIYAGFVNFKVQRPRDLWIISLNYIISRNPSIINADSKKIIESQFWQVGLQIKYAVGDDERILIFAIAAKYSTDILFADIIYTGEEELGFGFGFNTKNKSVDVIPGLLRGCKTHSLDSKIVEERITTEVLNLDSINGIFNSATPELQIKVHNALAEYNKWLNSIKSISNSNFQPFSNKFKDLTGYSLRRASGGRRTRRRAQRRLKFSMKRRRGRG